jgi:hypothetical protein
VNGCEDHEFATLDVYVRDQLDRAAEAYAAHIDIAARLPAVLEAAPANEGDESRGR